MAPTKMKLNSEDSINESPLTNSRSVVNRHLSDINDTISEADIRNVNPKSNNDTSKETVRKGKEVDTDDLEKQMPTSWNLID